MLNITKDSIITYPLYPYEAKSIIHINSNAKYHMR